MDMIMPVLLMVIGMALVTGLSATLYLRLPKTVFRSATRHGRYFGLGAQNSVSDKPMGNTPVSVVGSLHGQRA
jgi:hypothetical protein